MQESIGVNISERLVACDKRRKTERDEEGATYMVSLTQPTHDLLDLGQSLSLVSLLLGLLSLQNERERGSARSSSTREAEKGTELRRTAFPTPSLNCMFSPTVVVELLGPGGEFFSAPNLKRRESEAKQGQNELEGKEGELELNVLCPTGPLGDRVRYVLGLKCSLDLTGHL